jgi:predicted nuclease of predicted toxin-antitoxin system
MKLLLDENLSPRLVELLVDIGVEISHVRDVGLSSADDASVWEFAARGGFVIVTKDSDFNQRAFLLGPPPKVVWIRRGNASTTDAAELLRQHREDIVAFEGDAEASLLALA